MHGSTRAKPILIAIAAGTVVFSASAVGAQSPTTAPTPVFAEPPPQAIHCARLEGPLITSLSAPTPLRVTLDAQARQILVHVDSVPSGATCYAVYRFPAGTNPIASAWDPTAITAAGTFADHVALTAGHYCWQLFFGSPAGLSAPSEVCLDVPASIAPTPQPTPTQAFLPPPSAPDAGRGLAGSGGVGSAWLIGTITVLLTSTALVAARVSKR